MGSPRYIGTYSNIADSYSKQSAVNRRNGILNSRKSESRIYLKINEMK